MKLTNYKKTKIKKSINFINKHWITDWAILSVVENDVNADTFKETLKYSIKIKEALETALNQNETNNPVVIDNWNLG